MAEIDWNLINDATGANADKASLFKKDQKTLLHLKASGGTEEEIFKTKKNLTLLEDESKAWWRKALNGVEDWAVGEDADWQTYWERGLGKSNINLFMQHRASKGKTTFGKTGYDWRKAFSEEPDDTGAIERLFESLVGLGADLPTFGTGMAIGGFASGGNPFAMGFGGGFVNDSIKHMYLGALERGDVDTFGEFWEMFMKHGVSEGIKGGLTMGAMMVAPAALPYLKMGKYAIPTNKFTVASSRWAALTGVGAVVEGEMPTKETMVNNALILGLFGVIDPTAGKMVSKSAKKNKTDSMEIIDSLSKDTVMKQEVSAKNKKTFSKDKEIVKSENKSLKEELSELNKLDKESMPKVVENKQVEITRIESEIKTLKTNIENAKTESIKTLNKTKLELLEKDLVDLKENKGKFIEKKDVETFKKDQNVRVEKELVELEAKQADVLFELNQLKQRKKNNEFYNDSRLKLLTIEAKKNATEINNKRTLLKKDRRIEEIEKELAENGEPVTKTYEKNKDIKPHENVDVNFIIEKTGIGKIKLEKISTEQVKNSIIIRWLDRLYPLNEAVKNAKERGMPIKSFDLYKKMRIQMGNIGKGFHFIQKATFDFKTLKDNGKSFLEITKSAINDVKSYQEFTAYSIAKRAMEKFEQGISTIYSVSKADRAKLQNVIKEFEGKYGEVFKELNLYQQRVLTYLADAGILGKELYAKVLELNKDFVPLNKVLDLSIQNKGKDTGLGSTVKNPLKKMEGSVKERTTIDPLETMFLNTLHFIQIAERNAVNQAFIKMALDAQKLKAVYKGKDLIDPFSKDMIYEVKNLKEVKVTGKELEGLFLDSKGMSENAKNGLVVLRKQHGEWLKESQIIVYEKGKPKIYEVGVEYANALKDINKYQANIAMRILSVPTRTLRAGATLDPAFIFKNFGRDTFFAAAFSKNTFIPYWSSMQGLFGIAKSKLIGDKMYNKFMKSGAMQSTIISFDRAYFRDGQMYKELTGRNVHNVINPKNWLENLRILSEVFENASRFQDFKMTIKRLEKTNEKLPPEKKLTEREILEEAGFETRDLTVDFRKMGSDMQGYNMISAFFNARVQGVMKLKEGLFDPKRRGKVIKTSMLYITTPTILLWLKNKDSEVYRDLPQWQKDLFWIVITGEGTPDQTVWRIPKPFEIGWLFGTLPERLLDWMYQEDSSQFTTSALDFSKDFGKSFMPLPEFIRPFLEDSANENFFFERPIVPYSMEKILPEYQYTEYTSATAKLIAQSYAKLRESVGIFEMIGPNLDSPLKVENYIRAWTGGLGQYVLNILDYSFKQIGVTNPPIQPWSDNWVRNLADIPIIKAFVIRHPSSTAEPINKFWKLYKPIAREVETFEKLMADNNIEEAMKVWNRIDPELLYLIELAKPLKEMGDIVQLIYLNDGISPNDKRQLIDQFYGDMISIAKEALRIKKTVKKREK
jgi:hypothetical protein